eukprot:Opistho-2@69196
MGVKPFFRPSTCHGSPGCLEETRWIRQNDEVRKMTFVLHGTNMTNTGELVDESPMLQKEIKQFVAIFLQDNARGGPLRSDNLLIHCLRFPRSKDDVVRFKHHGNTLRNHPFDYEFHARLLQPWPEDEPDEDTAAEVLDNGKARATEVSATQRIVNFFVKSIVDRFRVQPRAADPVVSDDVAGRQKAANVNGITHHGNVDAINSNGKAGDVALARSNAGAAGLSRRDLRAVQRQESNSDVMTESSQTRMASPPPNKVVAGLRDRSRLRKVLLQAGKEAAKEAPKSKPKPQQKPKSKPAAKEPKKATGKASPRQTQKSSAPNIADDAESDEQLTQPLFSDSAVPQYLTQEAVLRLTYDESGDESI